MRDIRVSAKTVNDAITEASIQLGVVSTELEYEVIEKGSAGILGGLIGAKPAVIRATKIETIDDKATDFLEVLACHSLDALITNIFTFEIRHFVGVAAELADYDTKFDGIIKNLIGRTAVFETVDQAISVSRKYKQSLRLVTLSGELIKYSRFTYLMLNKPAGYISATFDKKFPVVTDLVPEDFSHLDLFPVGRLDRNSEGLLIMTNDGAFANRLMHPRHEVTKTYLVYVTDYRPGAEDLLRRPIELDGRPIREPKVRLLQVKDRVASFEVTIHEGRNRQVRRMCEAAGLRVTRLRRVAGGKLQLGNLALGKWRELTEEERFMLESD